MKIKFIIFSYLPVCGTHSFFFFCVFNYFALEIVSEKKNFKF